MSELKYREEITNCLYQIGKKFPSIWHKEELESVSNKTDWKDLNKNNCGIFAENQKEDFFRALNQIKLSDFSSEACKKYVKKNFDWEVVSEKFLNLITKK